MKKLLLLLLLPAIASADRLGALKSNADVLLTTQGVSSSQLNTIAADTTTLSQNFPVSLSTNVVSPLNISSGTVLNLQSSTASVTGPMTVGSFNILGSSAGQIAFREGLDNSVTVNQSIPYGVCTLWNTISSHTLVFSCYNSVSTFTVVGTSVSLKLGNIPVASGIGTGFSLTDSGIPASSILPTGTTFDVQFINNGVLAGADILQDNGSTVTLSGIYSMTETNVSTKAWANLYFDVSQSTINAGLTKLNGSVGTNGQVYTSGGAGAFPSWTTVSGGGGSSSLGIFQDGVQITSPTTQINVYGNDLSVSAHGATAYFALNSATTDFIHNQTSAQTATFNVTSGTVGTQFNLPYTGTAQVLLSTSGGNVTSSQDVTIHNANAMLNVNDLSNPYGLAAGYGVKVNLQGHLGSPTISYGVYATMGSGTSGGETALYGNASGNNAATNYGAFLSANAGANNYGLWVDSGQVQIQSSMTVVSAVSLSSGLTITAGGIEAIATGDSFANIAAFSTSTTGTPLVQISTIPAVLPADYELTLTSAATPIMTFGIQADGHIVSSGTVPTLGSCGSSPSIDGTDFQGVITVGGGVVTACTINFANAFGRPPVCICGDNSTTVACSNGGITSTAYTINTSATLGGGLLYYICTGNKG